MGLFEAEKVSTHYESLRSMPEGEVRWHGRDRVLRATNKFEHCLSHPIYAVAMSDSDAKADASQPLTGRQAVLADIAERKRKNPNWDDRMDPTYNGPFPARQPPRLPVRAALSFGRRIRDVRRALGRTQREVAVAIGVSARSIIRYEQGRSSPVQSAPLLALRQLESAH